MSRIYFHNVESTAEVSGRERHLLGNYCSRALLFALGDLKHFGTQPPWILKHIPASCYLHQSGRRDLLAEDIKTWLSVGYGPDAALLLGDERYPLFELQLNSALVVGGNTLKLAARLHGQCEIHCYVEGPNRNWLAGLIEEALEKAIFRKDAGWDSVCKLLHKADDSPVICSYSVCDSFPNRHAAGWVPEEEDEDGEGWYAIPREEQWELALAGIREGNKGLELTPDGWDDFHFGSAPVSGFDFFTAPRDA